jgi:hypothetical protein
VFWEQVTLKPFEMSVNGGASAGLICQFSDQLVLGFLLVRRMASAFGSVCRASLWADCGHGLNHDCPHRSTLHPFISSVRQ